MKKKLPVKIVLMSPDVAVPKYASAGAACFDLAARLLPEQLQKLENGGEGLVIPPGDVVTVGTGIKFEVEPGWRLDVYSRSGTWFKSRVRGAAQGRGTIDSDFRGEVMVSIENRGDKPFVIAQGDRIAQAELNEVTQAEFIVVSEEELSSTDRGEGGFGSTGTK